MPAEIASLFSAAATDRPLSAYTLRELLTALVPSCISSGVTKSKFVLFGGRGKQHAHGGRSYVG